MPIKVKPPQMSEWEQKMRSKEPVRSPKPLWLKLLGRFFRKSIENNYK